jgi:hypothetical protein
MRIPRHLTTLMLLVALALPTTGCMPRVGEAFPFYKVRQIEVEKTTMAEIREMFGEPWRTGLENGERTWTYGEYGVKISRDLVIRYDDRNVVKSYSFSSSDPADANL